MKVFSMKIAQSYRKTSKLCRVLKAETLNSWNVEKFRTVWDHDAWLPTASGWKVLVDKCTQSICTGVGMKGPVHSGVFSNHVAGEREEIIHHLATARVPLQSLARIPSLWLKEIYRIDLFLLSLGPVSSIKCCLLTAFYECKETADAQSAFNIEHSP